MVLGAEVTGLDIDDDRVTGVRWDGGSREADLVVLAIGVRPATDFLAGSGLEMADNGALRPDPHGRVAEHVWAAGDCCEVRRRIDDAWVFRPLGTYATKHGRALGDTLAGGSLSFDGMVDTSITRFAFDEVHVEVARTGLSRAEARGGRSRPGRPGHRGHDRHRLHARGRPDRHVGDGRPRRPDACSGCRSSADAGPASGSTPRPRCCGTGGTVDDLGVDGPGLRAALLLAWEVLQVAARRVAERL